MGGCMSRECKSEASWKPFVTTSVRNVVVNTLVIEPTLWMVKDCSCKKCAKVNKRAPTHEEALRHGKVLDESKRKSVALTNASSFRDDKH
jgi:hypothetical protein